MDSSQHSATEDYATVAARLGDAIPVVMKTYDDLAPHAQSAHARAFLKTALHPAGTDQDSTRTPRALINS